MSIEITIKGNSLKDCHDKILSMAAEIGFDKGGKDEAVVYIEEPVDAVKFSQQAGRAERNNPIVAIVKEDEGPKADVEAPKRRRRTKAEIEADNAKSNSEPIATTIPDIPVPPVMSTPVVPTADVKVEMPQAPVFAVPAAPVAPVVPTFIDTKSFQYFTENFVTIMSDLIIQGKINEAWVEKYKPVFNGAEMIDWLTYPDQLKNLHGFFLQNGLV